MYLSGLDVAYLNLEKTNSRTGLVRRDRRHQFVRNRSPVVFGAVGMRVGFKQKEEL
jgi:hypothetical protein